MKYPVGALPLFDTNGAAIIDGAIVAACEFCKARLSVRDSSCLKHYESMALTNKAFRLCPYGFTSYSSMLRERSVVITGVVAHPRFGDSKEMERAKRFPELRTTRKAVLGDADFYRDIEEAVLRSQKEAESRLPQALHELRKLNAIVKANADKLGGDDSSQQEVRDISGSAALMSNIFEVIEALANVDNLAGLKLDEFIAVYDLAFKAKKIYQVRAKIKPVHIRVDGDPDVAVRGSKKIFPLILTILLENSIKYAQKNSSIDVIVKKIGADCIISVSNRSDTPIDVNRCFDRGTRYAGGLTEGDGLGLFLASQIVRAHKGVIWCESVDGLITMKIKISAHVDKVRRAF